jgi:hypothetical protein
LSVVAAPERRSGPGPIGRLLALRAAWLSMDSNRAAQGFASTPLGLLVIHAGFLAALAVSREFSLAAMAMIAAALAGCALFPAHRKLVISLASFGYLALRPFRTPEFGDFMRWLGESAGGVDPVTLRFAAVAIFVLIAFGALETQRRFSHLTAAKRPVLAQFTAFLAILCLGLALPVGGIGHALLWAVLAVWASCFWMLAYASTDQKSGEQTPNVLRAAFLRPFWGGSSTPIGKNQGYLAKFDARTAEDLAVTRLKAVKLAVWTAILALSHDGLDAAIHTRAGLPTLHDAIMASVAGEAHPIATRWTSLVVNYFLDLLIIAAWGHAIVAVVRMAGYRIPRNTVNPLASRTLAEFWNRYFFYYKELLVDFFFYPAFLRWFKKTPRLRVACATFAAAGLGNFLYHVMAETHMFATQSWAEIGSRCATFGFYTLVLSAGLIVSQWRSARPAPRDGFWRYEVQTRLNVCLFFCFLKIFDDIFGHGTLLDRMAFFAGLFGV